MIIYCLINIIVAFIFVFEIEAVETLDSIEQEPRALTEREVMAPNFLFSMNSNIKGLKVKIYKQGGTQRVFVGMRSAQYSQLPIVVVSSSAIPAFS